MTVMLLAALPAWADFETAMSYLKAGKYHEAAAEFQALVDESPDYADGYHLLGICFLKSGKFEDAERNFLKAIEINGDKFDFHYNLANAYRLQNKHDKVVKTLNNAERLAADSQRYLVYQVRGHALASLNRWAEAIDDLERAVQARPDAATQLQLGKAYFAVGDNQGAVTALRKAIRMHPSPSGHELLVEAMINVAAKETNERAKRAKYAEAKAEAEKLLAANAASLDARYLVGRTALGAGEFDESIRVFDEVLGQQPRHCHAMANLGKAHVAKEDWSKAAAALERATDCDSGMNLAWESLGFVRQKMASGSKDFSVQQRYYQQAIAAYEKANAIKPTSSLAKAIADCQHNIDVSRENQAISRAEAEQDAAIEEEQQRREEEERKRREWQTRRDDG